MLKPVSKPKATRLEFVTQGFAFNVENMPNVSNTPDIIETGGAIVEKPKTPSKKNKKRKNQKDNRGRNNSNQSSSRDKDSSNLSCSPRPDRTTDGQKHNSFTGCRCLSHNFSKCYLPIGQDSDLITDEQQKNFENNMNAASFKKQVDDLRKKPESNSDKWGGIDGGSMKKVMYRVSAFSQFDLNAWSPDTLLDFTAFVHVFNIKERFSISRKQLRVKASYAATTLFLSEDGDRSHYP